MRIAVVGGKLQGVEACYLARKAGWHVRLVDCRPDVPARGLCDEFTLSELTGERDLHRVLGGVDLILPALENQDALDTLIRFSSLSGIAMAFDPKAYRLSSSKVRSDRLFAELGLPVPRPWPTDVFPVIAKPNSSSGSRGLRLICDSDQLQAARLAGVAAGDWVVQEFLSGPSYSLEVISFEGQLHCFQVTELFVDAGFDCKRVVAPAGLPTGLVDEFERIGRVIAEAIELRGLMDVEVILNGGCLKVLEIDARLPSQTPTVVYWSSGVNLVQVLCEAICGKRMATHSNATEERGVVYEHIHVAHGLLETGGEHVMTASGPLQVHHDFFGADEAITDYEAGRDDWRATLIITGSDRNEAWQKRCMVLSDVCGSFGINRCLDPEPMGGRPHSDKTAI
jgi:pyrrolysine biosynthesis protein PylC